MDDRASMDSKDRSRERSRRDRPSRFSESSRERSPDRGGGRDRGGMKSSNCRVYVSNIPYEYRWQDMKDLFRSQVGDVQFVELFVDENDKSRGCGIVEFSDSECVKKCLEVMQRFEVKTRKLIIKEDSGNVRDKHGNLVGSGGNKRNRGDDSRYRDDRYDSQPSLVGGPMSESPENKWGNTYGLSPHFLESLRIDTPLCNRVFVANLEYNVDKRKLKEVFRLAGRIVRVDLHIDKDGRSRGFAIVEFDHPVEAVQAISMFHNQVLFDRPMSVRIDRATENIKLPDGLKGIGMGLGTNGEPLRDVARNLPSIGNSQSGNSGAGLLGAVPNQALQVANALSGLSSVTGGNALSSLTSNPSILQAANNLAGMSGLASNLLSGAELSLANNLVNNPLVQNSAQLAALGGSGGSNNHPQGMGSNNSNSQSFSRDTNAFGSNQNSSFGQNQNFNSNGRNFQSSFENNKSTGYSFGGSGGGGGGNNRDGGYTSLGSNIGNNQMRQQGSGNMKDGGFSRKVLVSNLPASASYKMLSEKFNEFGEVQHLEEKGTGSMLVIYSADWQAERAIKNLDRARVDGRTIDARLFY